MIELLREVGEWPNGYPLENVTDWRVLRGLEQRGWTKIAGATSLHGKGVDTYRKDKPKEILRSHAVVLLTVAGYEARRNAR